MRKAGVFSNRVVVAATLIALCAGAGLAFGAGKVTRTKTVPVPGSSAASAKATCPKGKSVVMDGIKVTPASFVPLTIKGLARTSSRALKAKAVDYQSTPGHLSSIAYCAKSSKLITRSKSVTANRVLTNAPQRVATATCPKHTRVVFGGFAVTFDIGIPDPAQIYLGGSYRSSARKWSARGLNLGGGEPGTVKAIAYCSAVAQKTTPVLHTVTVPTGALKSATATCPRHSSLVSGGFKSEVTQSDEFVLLRGMQRTSRRAWKVTADNDGGETGKLTAIAYCS